MTKSREDFDKKYAEVIASIYKENDVDGTGTASDMLISSIRGHAGETYTDASGTYVFDIYPGIPEDFNWEEATQDYQSLISK